MGCDPDAGPAAAGVRDFHAGVRAAERRAVARAVAALRLTPVMFELGDAAALAASHQLGPLLEELRDPYLDAVSQLAMAWAATIVSDIDGTIRQASAALQERRGQDESYWTAVAVLTVGSHERAAGRYDDAQRDLSQAHALAERFGYTWLPPSPRCSWEPWPWRGAGWISRLHDTDRDHPAMRHWAHPPRRLP